MNQRDDQTNELLSAYLDGELSPDERESVVQQLGTEAERLRVLEELQAVGDHLRSLPSYRLDREFSGRVLAAASSDAPERSDQYAASPSPQRHSPRRPGPQKQGLRRPALTTWLTVATALAVAASLMVIVVLNEPPPNLVARNGNGTGSERGAATVPSDAQRSTGDQDQGTTSPPADVVHAQDDSPGDRTATDRTARPGTGKRPGTSKPREPDRIVSSDPDARTGAASMDTGDGNTATGGADPSSKSAGSNNMAAALPATRLLMVMDVTVSRAGQQRGAFEQQLVTAGAAFDGEIRTNPAMEGALLKSRFLVPRPPANGERTKDKPASAEPGRRSSSDLQLVYVVAQAGQVDAIWKAMKARKDWFPTVDVDMALKPTDMTVFNELRAAVRVQGLGQGPLLADQEQQRMVAHRLALPPGWKGAAPTKLRPATFPSMGPATRPLPRDPLHNQGPAQPPSSRDTVGQPMGHAMVAEILFVVHPQAP